MKGMWKRIMALLIACLFAIPFAAVSNALYWVDVTQDCSLRVEVSDESFIAAEERKNFRVNVYQIATLENRKGSLVFAPTGVFKGFFTEADLNLQEGQYTKETEEALAQKALQIAMGIGEYEKLEPQEPVRTISLFETCKGFETGMYLVVPYGAGQDRPNIEATTNEDGKTVYISTAEDATYTYKFSPMLVSLPKAPDPRYDDNTTDPVYDATVSLKGNRDKRSQKDLLLHKVDEEGRPIKQAGVTFELYCTRLPDGMRLEDAKTITTYVDYKDGSATSMQGYVTLYCIGEYTTDQNGEIRMEAPILDDNTLYAWLETRAPEGYVLDPEPHFFFSTGVNTTKDYAEFLNQPDVLATHLRYDPENPDAPGGMTVRREAITVEEISQRPDDTSRVTFSYAPDAPWTQGVFLRARVYNSVEYVMDGTEYGVFDSETTGDGWFYGGDGFYYYGEILFPGQEAEPLRVQALQRDISFDAKGSIAGRVAITYDFAPAVITEDWPIPHAEWDWDPMAQEEGGEEYSLGAGEAQIRPLVEATGGYAPEFTPGDPKTGKACYVERSVCNWENSDAENGLNFENKKQENPPDTPGVELPETGGVGSTVLSVAGGGLIAFALLLLSVKKRKRAR